MNTPTVTVDMTDEARVAFQTLGKLCENLHVIRNHCDRYHLPMMNDQEVAAWAAITGYLDAVGAPPRQLQPGSEFDALGL